MGVRMTLGRQLILSGMLVLLGLFIGMFMFTLQNTQHFLNSQLSSHAQDTANVLGLSLSHVMKDNDEVVASRMVDSIWDAGYYQTIHVENMEGKPLVTRDLKVKVAEVPQWFIHALDLTTVKQSAVIQSGWMRVGQVSVESNPGFAYKQMWETLKDSLVWLVVIGVIALSLGLFLLHLILKPLRKITYQANAICHQDFVVQEKLPWTIDLKQVVIAMNKMSLRLKTMFEEQAKATQQLQEQAYQSPVTGLGNRRYFDMQLEHFLNPNESFQGVLLLIELKDFKEFNQEQGYEKGDALLKGTSEVIKESTKHFPQAMLAHMGGADFTVILPNRALEVGEGLAKELTSQFSQFAQMGLSHRSDVAHIGVCAFRTTQSSQDILAQADNALRKAQNMGANAYVVSTVVEEDEILGAQAWGHKLDEVIRNKRIVLHYQPFKLYSVKGEEVFYESLLRLKDEKNRLIPAGEFIPMAERLSKMPQLDRLVLEKVVSQIKEQKVEHTYSVNLSTSSLEEEGFDLFILQQVQSLGKLAHRLIIELPEYGVVHHLALVQKLFRKLRAKGAHTAIDHYGKNFTSFGYLQSLSVSYLKIDGSFIRNISESEENQFFIRSLVRIGHSLDIQMIAENVETEQELKILRGLEVDGIQGYLLGAPQAEVLE